MARRDPTATGAAVTPFTIDIAQQDLDDLDRRLRRTRFAPDFGNDDWRYGHHGEYHRRLVEYWVDEYDWRDVERRMNELPHFTVDLMGVPLHFVHVRGTGPDPMPLLLHHGWPWTFWELRKVIGPLTDPAAHGRDPADSFDVVLISLPGHGFSSPIADTGWNWWTTADLEHVLMRDVLGYRRYATAGGDWGGLIAQQHGHKYEQDVIGVYTHFPAQLSHYLPAHPDAPPDVDYDPVLGVPDRSEYADDEAGWFERGQQFAGNESGYGSIQLTKPQTLAALLADSPAGQLAWITDRRYIGGLAERGGGIEAFERAWPKEDLITTAAIYFLTNTGGTSSRYYWECRNNPWTRSHDRFPVVGAPTAVSIFAGESYKPPRSFTEKYFNLQQYRVHDEGGHLAPAEVPALFVDDIATFLRAHRPTRPRPTT
ncbi:epoxide hydrolase family protein [Actinomycetospora termitidis]|uniref:Epoxide hydrolase n=1 Tax=Actinomycetospora termitidis TaxID=3053470 RepID=A0ABT7M6H1_9PSEU|nr:epoxide hydrolase family protein [Actinomycetospora sp. Odt1-22]MDL5156230.1 epoxide hydrolase [Actinomycetospora sp. Odt1-22]